MGWLVFSNLYVAFCGATLTAASYVLLGERPRIDAVVMLVFFGTLVVYNLDRLVEPRPGDSPHEQWVARHRTTLWGLTGVSTIGCVVCLGWIDAAVAWSLPIAGALSIGYCLPTYRYRGRWHRLKALRGAKLLLIAGIWTFATAGLPILSVQSELTAWTLWPVVLARFLFILAVALPFDIPDMDRDRAAGIVTLPQSCGVTGARAIALALMVTFGVVAIANPWPAAAGLLVSGALALALLAAMNERRGVIYYEVLLDGSLLAQAALLVLATGGSGRPV